MADLRQARPSSRTAVFSNEIEYVKCTVNLYPRGNLDGSISQTEPPQRVSGCTLQCWSVASLRFSKSDDIMIWPIQEQMAFFLSFCRWITMEPDNYKKESFANLMSASTKFLFSRICKKFCCARKINIFLESTRTTIFVLDVHRILWLPCLCVWMKRVQTALSLGNTCPTDGPALL